MREPEDATDTSIVKIREICRDLLTNKGDNESLAYLNCVNALFFSMNDRSPG